MTLLGSEHSLLIRSKFRSVLQLRLQQRRTREQLADQGIMPPLKSPAAFHEQRKSLERSKTGDYLKHKIRSRPEKADLVNMHILQDSATGGSIQATQMKLKRARLADDLNEKIALRPGPLELVEKNIIPVDSAVKEAAMKVNHGKFPKQEDSYAFEEDSSSDSLSPEQPHSNESQGSVCSSSEAKSSDSSSPALTSSRQGFQNREMNGHIASPNNQTSQEESQPMMNNNQLSPPVPVPAVVKMEQSKSSDKNRHKKLKDTKPKVKKLKYHQYIPPDQKAEKSPPPMDSAYARLLQQQQLFLQLQILSQQKHHHSAQQRQQSFSFQPLHSLPHKQSTEQLARNSNASTSTVTSSSSSPVKTFSGQSSISPIKPGPLPSNLDDLKVSELRQQLRIRGLPVSGTKTALIERLRPFKDPNASPPSSSGDITTVTFPVTPTGSLSSYQSSGSAGGGGFYPFCSTSSTPPISPASSDLSVSGSLPDSFSDVTMSSPQFGLQPSPAHLSADEGLAAGLTGGCLHGEAEGPDAEKDKMLVEKQKVIEELTWKLHQEQRQVEELKMQLHKRKHSQQDLQASPQQQRHLQASPKHPLHLQPPAQQHFFGVSIKQEHVASSCPLSCKQLKSSPSSCMEGLGHLSGLAGPRCMDPSVGGSPSTLSAFLSPQCSPQHSPIPKAGSPQHSSLPSSPHNPYLLPGSSASLTAENRSHSPLQTSSRPQAQGQQKNLGQPVNCSYSEQRSLQSLFPSPASSAFHHRDHPKAKNSNMQHKMALLHSPRHVGQKFPISSATCCSSDSASKIKRPPCYEDAVKQQLTRSQQMDELLDVLIESGVSSGSSSLPVPKFHRHYEHLSPSQLSYEHGTSSGDHHLEALLNGPMGRIGEIAIHKMAPEEGQLEDTGEGFTAARQEKLLNNREMMGTPLSPMDARVSPANEGQGLSMAFTESPWETMEWLDLTPPSSATGFSSIPPAGPSIFNAEFLDVSDINLNSAMDLHLEQW